MNNTPAPARSRPSQPEGAKFAVPRTISQQASDIPKEARNMLTSGTWSSNDEDDHDFLEEESLLEDFAPPPARRFDGSRSFGRTSEVGLDDYASMDLKIISKELEMLKVQWAQKQRLAAKFNPEAVEGEEFDDLPRSSEADKRHRRRLHTRRLQQEAPVREQHGRKRYTVEVDMKGNPCGGNRHLWLKCLRGHAVHLHYKKKRFLSSRVSVEFY